MEIRKTLEGMVVDGSEETDFTPGSERNSVEKTETHSKVEEKEKKAEFDRESTKDRDELDMDYELTCIDFFLRYISNLYPLWGEYGDNLMFHIAQIYGAIDKEEFSPYLRILDSIGLKIKEVDSSNGTSSNETDNGRTGDFFTGDTQTYPLDIEKCDPQICIRAILYLDSYREWLDNMLSRSKCGLEGVSQVSEAAEEGQIGRPINEWKPIEVSGELVLPLVYQAYVKMEVKKGDYIGSSRRGFEHYSQGTIEKNHSSSNGGKGQTLQGSPSKSGNEVGVTYEKNRDRWVAVWTENGIRRSRIFNVKQYGFETARELAIQYRREQLANIQNKVPTGTPVQAVRNSKRRRSLEGAGRSGRTSPSAYNTRNSCLESINLQNPDFEVFFDQERDSWVCRNITASDEQEIIFSVEEFGAEKARELAIERAGGLADDAAYTPTKKGSTKTSSKGVTITPKRRDYLVGDGTLNVSGDSQNSASSSFRIRISTNGLGSKGESGSAANGYQPSSEQNSSNKSESRRSASGEEFLVYHGKKYYFGPVIEGIRYDKIQNRWVTGYIGQDGRKRYKYFSIGAYGFEGSRQLAIEYRESMYPSTKGVDRLSEFLQTIIQGFPAFEDGVLQDVSFEDLIIHKGQLKDGSDRSYFCIPSKGDFLVTTPADQGDEQLKHLLNRYRRVLENNGGKEEHLLRESILASSRQELKPSLSGLHSTSGAGSQKESTVAVKGRSEEQEITGGSKKGYDIQEMGNSQPEQESIKIEGSINDAPGNNEREYIRTGAGSETNNKGIEGHRTNQEDEVELPKSIRGLSDYSESKGTPSSRSSASMYDFEMTANEDSMYIETEDKVSPNSRKRFFIGPKIDGVFYNPAIHRWVSQYEVDGVKMTKNFSAKSYGFEKSRYLAIQWRIKFNGEPPQLGQLIQALQDHGIEYPPK
ncbi:putative transcription factor with AP2 domain(s) [Cryptosporidium felis]|nr:putative transcription factor with AP2 domain(s) [Cryptosporidium felis]